jgi:hypothetical protein
MASFASRKRIEAPTKAIRQAELSARRPGGAGDVGGDCAFNTTVDAIASVRKCENGWHLEIVFATGVSIVWDDPFPSQHDALRVLDQFCEETSAVEIQMH